MPFLLRRIRYQLSKSFLHEYVIAHRNRIWTANDVFIGEYPKSGLTWLRFLLYEGLTRRPAGFPDVNRAITDRSHAAPLLSNGGRVVPTHEPYRTDYRKAVYLVRDARDVISSEYAFEKALALFNGDFDSFIRAFLAGKVNAYGAWHRHVTSWLDAADAGKVDLLVVRYEDLRADPEAKLAEILRFYGEQPDPDVVRAAVQNNSLEKMRAKEDAVRRTPPPSGKAPLRKMQNEAGNRFVRDGKVGGWRSRLSEPQIRAIEAQAGGAIARLGYPLAADLGILDSNANSAIVR
jgi:hypothetical protein